MLPGRLGLETARIPHTDRHGLLWLGYGNLYVKDGTLRFLAAKSYLLDAGDYAIPYQMLSCILLGPGTTASHDVLRLCARHGCAMVAVGQDGVRMYTAQPHGPDASELARRQAMYWADRRGHRVRVIREMYAMRFGDMPSQSDVNTLRGIEGMRVRKMYQEMARRYGVEWHGRRYDRANPDATDPPNQAINHAATAVEAAASVAVAATATIPQLGFVHEDSSNSFCLDIADLYRQELTVAIAFEAVCTSRIRQDQPLERIVRRLAGERFRRDGVIPGMIDRIKEILRESPFARNDEE